MDMPIMLATNEGSGYPSKRASQWPGFSVESGRRLGGHGVYTVNIGFVLGRSAGSTGVDIISENGSERELSLTGRVLRRQHDQ
jgi:hypothetical protein